MYGLNSRAYVEEEPETGEPFLVVQEFAGNIFIWEEVF